jgi:hypothetical protein
LHAGREFPIAVRILIAGDLLHDELFNLFIETF